MRRTDDGWVLSENDIKAAVISVTDKGRRIDDPVVSWGNGPTVTVSHSVRLSKAAIESTVWKWFAVLFPGFRIDRVSVIESTYVAMGETCWSVQAVVSGAEQ